MTIEAIKIDYRELAKRENQTRHRALDDAAKAICPLCRDGKPMSKTPGFHSDLTWAGSEKLVHCAAKPIHELFNRN